MNRLTLVLIAVVSAACVDSGDSGRMQESDFLAPDFGEVAPWTHDSFDATGHKFTFAVHSDLTGGERDGIYEVAIAQLNLLRPEFIINVGDLIFGGSDETTVKAQWDSFDERAMRARAPVFYVAGNHDRTGPLLQGVWDSRNGPGYYHFRYKDVLFLVLDTEDHAQERGAEIAAFRREALRLVAEGNRAAALQSDYRNITEGLTGNISVEQSEYMIDAINANADVRWTFLFMHKAPWLREDMTTFSAIETVLADRPYTVFHGHLHALGYQERHGNDYIRLATTGGGQRNLESRAVDHVTLVTVDNNGVDIANILLEGILDKTGQIPLNGSELCFESTRCAERQ